VIEHGFRDRRGRLISLRVIGDDWRAVADVAPRDDQRRFVAALAALYLLLSDRGGLWTSLAVYADDLVVGHVMWAVDDDGSHWIGGVLVDAPEQGAGVGRAMTRTMLSWFATLPGPPVVRLSYHPDNQPAGRLYRALGFSPTGEIQDSELVLERKPG
jgi:diamine N-acetyltransferase